MGCACGPESKRECISESELLPFKGGLCGAPYKNQVAIEMSDVPLNLVNFFLFTLRGFMSERQRAGVKYLR